MTHLTGFLVGAVVASVVLIATELQDAGRLQSLAGSVVAVFSPANEPEDTVDSQPSDQHVALNTQPVLVPAKPLRDQSLPVSPDRAEDDAPAAIAAQRHPIWKPFRSELSADGFADYLGRLTGQAFYVRRRSSWTYQVEVVYNTDEELDATLRDIESKTGVPLEPAQ